MNFKLLLLWLAQALSTTVITLNVTIAGLAGAHLADAKVLATLPLALGAVATAISTIPLGILFSKYPRRPVLLMGSVVFVTSLLATYGALRIESFSLLVVAQVLLGASIAFVLSYRFTATNQVKSERFALVHGFFVAAGLVSGILGPTIGTSSITTTGLERFYQPYEISIVLALVVFGIFLIIGPLLGPKDSANSTGKKAAPALSGANMVLAFIGGGISAGCMLLVMHATPLVVHTHSHTPGLSLIMSAHFVGMYLPGLFAALLMKRLGSANIVRIGAVMGLIGCAASINLQSNSTVFITMTLVGVSWGFITVATATMVSRFSNPRVESKYNFIVAGVGAASTLLVAPIVFSMGWFFVVLFAATFYSLLVVVSFFTKTGAAATTASARQEA